MTDEWKYPWLRKGLLWLFVLEAFSPLSYYFGEAFFGSYGIELSGLLYPLSWGIIPENLVTLLLGGLPFWILYATGWWLRITSLLLISLGSLGMCLWGLYSYHNCFYPAGGHTTGEEGIVFVVVGIIQLCLALGLAICALIFNWLLKKFAPALP